MRTKWLGGLGVLGVVIGLMLLSPDPVDGQQGPPSMFGKKGMKGGGYGGLAGPGGGYSGQQYGGGSIPAPGGGGQPIVVVQMQPPGGPGGPQGYGMQYGGQGGDRGGYGGMGGDRGGYGMKGGDRGSYGGMGGDRGGPGGMMGKGMGSMDPAEKADKTFSYFARATGGDVIDMGKLPPESRFAIRGVFEKYGVAPPRDGDVITRQQFVSTVGPAMARMSGDRGSGGDRGGPGGYGDPNRSWNDPGNNWGSDPNRDRKDDKKDGKDDKKDKKDKEPAVFAVRYGKLPDGLPLWWGDYDTNKDGQIGLHEWRLADEPTAKFYEMDLDGDGLLTPDEYLRYKNRVEENEKVVAMRQAAEDGEGRPTRPSSGGMGGDRNGNHGGGDTGPNPFRMGGSKDDANSQGGDRSKGGDRPGKGKGKGKKGGGQEN